MKLSPELLIAVTIMIVYQDKTSANIAFNCDGTIKQIKTENGFCINPKMSVYELIGELTPSSVFLIDFRKTATCRELVENIDVMLHDLFIGTLHLSAQHSNTVHGSYTNCVHPLQRGFIEIPEKYLKGLTPKL